MDTSDYILSLADRCVKCGLCLPHCPTYALSSNENESPRGRIALIQGWLQGQLEPSENLYQHLDQCLLCRRCESVCPSLVPYGEIMDEARHIYKVQTNTSFAPDNLVERIGLKLLVKPSRSDYLLRLLRLLQQSGLLKLFRFSGILSLLKAKRIISFLPSIQKPLQLKNYYPADNQANKSVALFTGCLSTKLDQTTVKSSIHLLNMLGFNVYIPQQQVCCGALDLHEGNKAQTQTLAEQNIAVFNQLKISNIISLVNGCSAQLKEYKKLSINNEFNSEVKDIVEFLAEIQWPDTIKFKLANKRYALHIPCTLQNSLKANDKLLALLNKISGMELPPNAIYNSCCGAAGSYFLRNPDFSDSLQHQAIINLLKTTPDFIISSNIGCTLHLKAGLSAKNFNTGVIHPVVFLQNHIISAK